MNGATYQIHFDERESLRKTLMLSLGLHALLVVVVVGYNLVGAHMRGTWGTSLGGGGTAVQIGAVASLPGVPLPSPMQPTRSSLATQRLTALIGLSARPRHSRSLAVPSSPLFMDTST